MATIETQKLTKYYGKSRGIENLDLIVEKGEVLGFLGPNGAGKTTTIRCLVGLILPTSGSATVFGKDIVKDSVAIRSDIGFIPGDVHMYPRMTGDRFLDYMAGFRKKKPVLKEELVKKFDLDLTKRVKDLSRGNKQKLGIIMALMHDPSLLVLDEPTLGLDPLMQKTFYDLVREFRDRGKTVFLSSHILSEVEGICDRVGIIKDGSLISVERVEDMAGKKVRHLEVTFAEDVPEKVFDIPGVEVIISNKKRFKLRVKSEVDPVIKAIAKFKVDDIVFEHASLEEVFFEYYGEGG